MSAEEDFKLIHLGIGFTNMVARPTKGSADLTRKEIKEGSLILLEKLKRFKPKIAVFNGKLIFEVFSGKKDFNFGKQPETIDGTNTVNLREAWLSLVWTFLFFSVHVGDAIVECSVCTIAARSRQSAILHRVEKV